jgi:DNA-binding response OmpR family regulator
LPYALLTHWGGVSELTRLQWLLFKTLRDADGRILPDETLIATVWPGQVPRDGDSHRLRVLIHQTRCRLQNSQWLITRHRSRGYQIVRVLAAA